MKSFVIAAATVALFAVPALAQAPSTKSSEALRAECTKSPGSAACAELEKRGPAPRAGDPTISPGPGKADETKGGGKAGGVTPGGNPSTPGGGPRTGQ